MLTTAHDRINSRSELKVPSLHLNALSAALQEVADAPHSLPEILRMVETRDRDRCQIIEQGYIASHHHLVQVRPASIA